MTRKCKTCVHGQLGFMKRVWFCRLTDSPTVHTVCEYNHSRIRNLHREKVKE